ncbi:MAG TPA: hypothetical protein VIM55_18205 [Mucilaginibacter sp.]
MSKGIAYFNWKKLASQVDWKLLLFLLLFLDVKLAVKIPAIILIYLLRFNFKFGFSFKNSRLPLFYLLIMVIPFIGLVIGGGYSNTNYLLVFATGLAFWALSLLAIHQVKLSVENNDTEIIHNTIFAFFIINAIFSFSNYAAIVWETGAINPYRYQGDSQKYFIATGDYIRGLTFDTSTTNAALNAFGVIYFLTRKKYAMMLVCMTVLLYAGSNFLNLALLLIFALLFIFRTDKVQKSVMVVCLMMLVVFMAKISPQNDVYAQRTLENFLYGKAVVPSRSSAQVKCTNIPSLEEKRRIIANNYIDSVKKANLKKLHNPKPLFTGLPQTGQGRIFIDTADINSLPYQKRTDTSEQQLVLLKFIGQHKNSLTLSNQKNINAGIPGKLISFVQTLTYFKQHPVKAITGAGIGNFSSKLAFRATSFGFAGGFPAKHTYINSAFLTNHLDVYLTFFSKDMGYHSLANSPFSVYDQLLAEYGLLGLLAFAIYYLGFFAKHASALTYGLPLLLLLLMIFLTDYWFEQLSVIVFFELLMLLNIKETTKPVPVPYAS